MAKVFQYTADGFYAGEFEDYGGPLPNNATRTAPQLADGHIPQWNGKKWVLVEDHKGKEGYLKGEQYTVKEYGPLPVGWSDTPPPPTPEKRAEQRKAEIKARLAEIDVASVRPLRAIAQGDAVQEDRDKLAALDAEAAALRLELTGLETV